MGLAGAWLAGAGGFDEALGWLTSVSLDSVEEAGKPLPPLL